uniref:Uncharacterized protein n=1 Tax=Panagrolaimus superbus TaxID=310955 RepID=A0A914YZC5_9BILA
MDFNSLKAQIVEKVKQSVSQYIEERVDELLREFFAPLLVQKAETEGGIEVSTQVTTSLQSSKASASLDNIAEQTSVFAEEHDHSLSATSSRLSVLDKPSAALDFSEFVKYRRSYHLSIFGAMCSTKSLNILFNNTSQGLLYIVSQYHHQFSRVIPGFGTIYRQFVAYNNVHDPIVFKGHTAYDRIQELQHLLFDYLCFWIKSAYYLGQEKRTSGIRHMWKCNHPGEERVLVVGLSFDMFALNEQNMDEDVYQIITAFFVKKVDVNPVIANFINSDDLTVESDISEENELNSSLGSLNEPIISDLEITKATLRVLLNGTDPACLFRNSPLFSKTILSVGKHDIAKHEIRIMFNNVHQGILHLLIVWFDRFRKLIPEFESLPLEILSKRDVLTVAGNVSRNSDLSGENALIYLQCLVYRFLHSSIISENYLGYENRSFGQRHVWTLPKSFEDDMVLALTLIDEIVIEDNKCYYKVNTAFFLPLSYIRKFQINKPSAEIQSPFYFAPQTSIRKRGKYGRTRF